MTRLEEYYQLTKPGIIYGNIMTAAAGFLLAAQWSIDLRLFAATIIGTSLVIAAACTYNNILDRHIDQKMKRTQKRAVAAGRIGPRQALIFATLLAIAGFATLWFGVNRLVTFIGVIAIIDYVILYGWSKRHSVHGTLVGSICGAAPITAGYVAVTNQLDAAAILLFVIMIAWQMPHFYAIAMYRAKDYAAAHIPVLPLVKGNRATKQQILAYIALFGIACTLLTLFGYTGYLYFVVMTGTSLWWFITAMRELKLTDNVRWAKQMFGRSLVVLLVLSAAVAMGAIFP